MALEPDAVDRAARILVAARLETRTISELPPDVRPRDLSDAYAISDRLAVLLGWEVAGWYCACTNAGIQRMLGLAEPYFARLFAPLVFESPATLRAADFPPMIVECEFGFRLGRDLPARAAVYERDEVADAVLTVHPTIEVVAGHLENWTGQDVFSVIADNGTDGALVVGPGTEAWPRDGLPGIDVELECNGTVQRRGAGGDVLGDPLDAFCWLVNARSRAGEGLRAGQISNTGTATAIYPVRAGDSLTATFGELGSVHLQIV